MQTIIGYLKEMLNDKGDFLKEFMALDDKDREQLREYAKEEMIAKGIAFDDPRSKEK